MNITLSGISAKISTRPGLGQSRDWAGLTPLLIASMNGRAECVLSLLRAGADIYAADSQGRTSLELTSPRSAQEHVRATRESIRSQLILILISGKNTEMRDTSLGAFHKVPACKTYNHNEGMLETVFT
eukprot:scaffold29814_cov78-Phaeocystis_antarctica.AAC.1